MRIQTAILVLLLGVSVTSFAQRKKKKDRKAEVEQVQQPTTLHPLPGKEQVPVRASRKKSDSRGPTFESEREYYDRMEAVAKERRKAEKMMMKPQYSDPMYFGHKRPPKKRKAGKLKYCKECGIRH